MSELRYYFEVLEIPANASYEEARAAYRDLVDVWHPDRYSRNTRLQHKATEKLKQINTAWQHLDAYYRTARDATSEQERQSGIPPQVRCQKCQTLNNVPPDMALYQAKCGACGTRLCTDQINKPAGKKTGIIRSGSHDRKAGVSVAELAAGLSVGLIVVLILLIMKSTLF